MDMLGALLLVLLVWLAFDTALDAAGDPGRLRLWTRWTAIRDRRAAPAPAVAVEVDPADLDRVRQRIVVLARELDDLDDDSQVFAAGFHSFVVREAYRALVADEARLTDQLRLCRERRAATSEPVLELLAGDRPGSPREVLDVGRGSG